MIIQCEQCQTKFKLDDSKVADKSIKVRCAKCRHVFSVAGSRGVAADSAPLVPNVPEFLIEEDLVPAEAAPLDSFSFAADEEQTIAANPSAGDDSDFPLPSPDSTDANEAAVLHVSTEELKPSQDLLFAPLAKAETKPELDFTTGTIEKTAPAAAQEEPPPLSIGSRRKESPRKSAMLVFLGIVIAGLAVFYSYWGYMTLTENKHVVPQETGQITVRSVEASFIKNNTAGELLVISGEAVNTYDKPRAAIQIKGFVYGAKGEEVSSKSVFCGNPLSKEQLSTMTMDKIEAAMANQFGDSLKNMEVAPGNAIPFVIVIPKPSAGATDYGVVPVGSTVATGGKEK